MTENIYIQYYIMTFYSCARSVLDIYNYLTSSNKDQYFSTILALKLIAPFSPKIQKFEIIYPLLWATLMK